MMNFDSRSSSMKPENQALLSTMASLLPGVLESVMDAILTVDEQQKIILFNCAAESMFGWHRQQVMHQPLDRLIPGRFHATHARQVAQFGVTGMMNYRRMGAAGLVHGLRANGDEFPIDVAISQVDTPEGKIYTVIVRDLTERKWV